MAATNSSKAKVRFAPPPGAVRSARPCGYESFKGGFLVSEKKTSPAKKFSRKPTPAPKQKPRVRSPHSFPELKLLACKELCSFEQVKSEDEHANLGKGFGCQDPLAPEQIYLRAMGNTGSVTTNRELSIKITDFFDYSVTDPLAGGVAQEVSNYFFNIDQNLFENGTSSPFDDRDRTFCRVRACEVFVLPVKGFNIGTTGNNDNNAAGMFTVNCQTPGVSTVNSQGAIALDTQVTNILPQIDTFWKKVFHCDLQKTFQSGVARPYFDTVVDNFAQCIFQMSIVDSTSGVNYLSVNDSGNDELVIRVKVVLHIDQPIATIQNAKLTVFRNESFLTPSLNANGGPFVGTEESYVQMNLQRAVNYLR